MDDKKKLEAAGTSLLDLVETHARSTKKRFLRGVFEQVEESLKQGVPTKIIVESLRKNGLDITDGYFTSAMSQIRKEKGTARISKPEIGKPSSSPENAPPANSTEPQNNEQVTQFASAEQKPEGESTPPTGIVDVFTRQAEREAKKNSEPKIQKIPRR